MKKFKFVVFIFVFWWSILCPPLGFPEDSIGVDSSQSMNSLEAETSPSIESSEPEIHFQFKYFTFFNSLFN